MGCLADARARNRWIDVLTRLPCTKWRVAPADFSGVHSRQSRPFTQRPHSLMRSTNLWPCCSPWANPYRVAIRVPIPYQISDPGHEPRWYVPRYPGQWCRRISTDIRTVTNGRKPEISPSSTAHTWCAVQTYVCAFIAFSYTCSVYARKTEIG